MTDHPEPHPVGVALLLSLGLWIIMLGLYWLTVR